MSIDYIPKLKEWAVSGGLKKVFSFSVLSIPAIEPVSEPVRTRLVRIFGSMNPVQGNCASINNLGASL
jgi:hypothetical protein